MFYSLPFQLKDRFVHYGVAQGLLVDLFRGLLIIARSLVRMDTSFDTVPSPLQSNRVSKYSSTVH